jgi:endonuclease/exonuclease/phosphatase family metal-dependent hydrolase
MKRRPIKRLALSLLLVVISLPQQGYGEDPKQSGEATSQKLRVITFNIWGLPFTPHRSLRYDAMIPALKELKPDLVGFQELWIGGEVEAFKKRLEKLGLNHFKRFPGLTGGGLLIASRFPIEQGAFTVFSLGGNPRAITRGDYYANKGVGAVLVRTPLGAVVFANTHLHASYSSNVYEAEQISQMLEVSDFLGAPELQKGPEVSWVAEHAVILVGDFNRGWDTLACELLVRRSHFQAARDKQGIDALFSRSGKDLFLRSLGGRVIFKEKVQLAAGISDTLSDHAAVMVDFMLSKTAPGPSSQPPSTKRPWADITRDVAKIIDREVKVSQLRRVIDIVLGLLFIALAVFVGRRDSDRIWLKRLALGVAVVIALGCLFLTVHDHHRIQGLAKLLPRLPR